MAKQVKVFDSGELSRQTSNPKSKSPQRSGLLGIQSTNPGKIYKDIHSIVKVNSSALLKKKSLKRIKTISPMLGKSPSYSLLAKNSKPTNLLSKKPSLKMLDNNLPGINSTSVSYRSATPTKNFEINPETEPADNNFKKTKQKPKSFEKVLEKYEMYKGIFDEIIQKDKTFMVILKKIKDSYEEFYEMSILEHTFKLKEKIERMNDLLLKKTEEVDVLDKRVRKLSNENYELAKSLERSEEICSGIQERLNKISKFSMNSIPKDEETWKSLIIENEAYSISFKNLEKKLKFSKENEKKLRQILADMKSSGISVQEFIEKSAKKEKKNEFFSEKQSETSESEYLISNRLQDVIKPENVPGLELEKLQSESLLSSGEYSEYYNLS